MLTLYRQLMRLYPAEHREQFGDEMLSVLCDVRTDIANKNMLMRGLFCVREIAGLVRGALRENLHTVMGVHAGIRFTTRRLAMRNGFRFPKATAILMTIILAGVIVAIRKGEAIATSLPPFSQPITPVHPPHSYLLPGVVAGLLFVYVAGLAGWAIVFALRRSGVHRLADMSGQPK